MHSRVTIGATVLACGLSLPPFVRATTIYNNGAPDQSDGSNITGFVAADDFILDSAVTLTGGTFWSSPNFDPFTSQFSCTIGWAIHADRGGTPCTILFSGSDSSPVLTDTGVQIFGTEEWRIVFSLGSLNLGPGTFWLVLHEGALGTPDDGTTSFGIRPAASTARSGRFPPISPPQAAGLPTASMVGAIPIWHSS
jgi:hypothetical protein